MKNIKLWLERLAGATHHRRHYPDLGIGNAGALCGRIGYVICRLECLYERRSDENPDTVHHLGRGLPRMDRCTRYLDGLHQMSSAAFGFASVHNFMVAGLCGIQLGRGIGDLRNNNGTFNKKI